MQRLHLNPDYKPLREEMHSQNDGQLLRAIVELVEANREILAIPKSWDACMEQRAKIKKEVRKNGTSTNT